MLTWLTALALVQAIQPAQSAELLLPSPAEFSAADVVTRRALMKQVDVRIDTSPETTFPLIEVGLLDPDGGVRETAAGALRNLRTTLLRWRIDPSIGRRVGMPAPFLATLSAGLDSPDGAVRLQSMDTLVSFDPDTDRTKSRLLDRYPREPAPLLRAQLLMHLRAMAPDDSTVQRVVLTALDDPEAAVRYQGVLGVAVWTPDAFLARAGRGLEESDPAMRLAWADALGAYGSRAVPYLGNLRQLLAAATDPRDRSRIQAALAAVQPVAPPTPTPAPTLPGAAPR